jgi:hypothetical protein
MLTLKQVARYARFPFAGLNRNKSIFNGHNRINSGPGFSYRTGWFWRGFRSPAYHTSGAVCCGW